MATPSRFARRAKHVVWVTRGKTRRSRCWAEHTVICAIHPAVDKDIDRVRKRKRPFCCPCWRWPGCFRRRAMNAARRPQPTPDLVYAFVLPSLVQRQQGIHPYSADWWMLSGSDPSILGDLPGQGSCLSGTCADGSSTSGWRPSPAAIPSALNHLEESCSKCAHLTTWCSVSRRRVHPLLPRGKGLGLHARACSSHIPVATVGYRPLSNHGAWLAASSSTAGFPVERERRRARFPQGRFAASTPLPDNRVAVLTSSSMVSAAGPAPR